MSFTRKLTTAILAACFVCFPAMAEREQFQCTLLAPTATAGTVLFGDGTAAAPSMSFANDPDTGIARSAANAVGFATGANWRAHVTGIGFTIGNQPDFSGAPQNGILTATGGSGTNIAGADLRIRGGYSTGNASGGSLRFETSPAGSSGSAQNTLTERMRITSSGDVYFGNGELNASPVEGSIRATNGTGTNIAGANLAIVGGNSTGTGAGGVVRFLTAAAGSTGSSSNTLTERMRITSDGEVGIGSSTATSNRLALSYVTASGVAKIGPNSTGGNTSLALGTSASGTYADRITITSDGQIQVGDGTAAAPVLSFSSDPDTGIYRPGADSVGIVTNATERLRIASQISGPNGSAAGPAFTFLSDQDNGMYRVSADTVGFATAGTNRISVKPNGQVRYIPLAADPAGAEAGDVYYNSGTNKLRVYNGTAWVDLH